MNLKRSVFTFLLASAIGLSAVGCARPSAQATPTSLPTSTLTASPTATLAPTSTRTLTPTITLLPTETLNATATQQYNDMLTFVNGLKDDGYLKATDGAYHPLDDYSKQWAQLDWYRWNPTGWSPADFVLRAHMAWSSDFEAPSQAGCGVVFHIQKTNDHYAVFVLSQGDISFGINIGQFSGSPLVHWGPSQNSGEVDFAMTAVGSKFDIFVNGKHIQTFTGYQGKMTGGDLGFTVLSGTNAGYGTECSITHAELWMLK